MLCSGERTTPAAVALLNGEWVMGEAALQNQTKNPKSFFGNLLPLVGTHVSDAVLAQLTQGVSAAKQADGQVLLQPCTASGAPEGPPKLAAEMLTMLLAWFKRLADENAGGLVGPCVLTVSFFDPGVPAQRGSARLLCAWRRARDRLAVPLSLFFCRCRRRSARSSGRRWRRAAPARALTCSRC